MGCEFWHPELVVFHSCVVSVVMLTLIGQISVFCLSQNFSEVKMVMALKVRFADVTSGLVGP